MDPVVTEQRKVMVYFRQNPKMLFMVDGVGALLTALSLLVMTTFPGLIGLPPFLLVGLSATALAFSCYSILCSLLLRQKWRRYLRLIAWFNLLYCATTLYVLIGNYANITAIGKAYFVVEIGIIGILVFFELRTAVDMADGE